MFNSKGSISFWHYDGFPESHPGFHLTADSAGCDFLLGLLKRVDSRKNADPKPFSTKPPGAPILTAHSLSAKPIAARKVQLILRPELESDYWEIKRNHQLIEIHTGEDGIKDLVGGITGIAQKNGDWKINSGNSSLSMWRFPENVS